MKNLLLILLLTFCCLHTYAQQDTLFTYFSKTYAQEDTTNVTTFCVEPDTNGYIVAGILGYQNNYITFIKKINLIGEIIWYKQLHSSEHNKELNKGALLIKDSNGHFVLAYATKYPNGSNLSNGEISLVKFTSDGDILLQKEFENDVNEQVAAICEAHDGGYLITGWRQYLTFPPRIYVMKIDVNGEEVWTQSYYEELENDTRSSTIQPTSDGGYIIGGILAETYDPPTYYDSYLIKINHAGEKDWHLIKGSDENDGYLSGFQKPNNNYFLYGAKVEDDIKIPIFVEVDSIGNIISEKDYIIDEAGFASGIFESAYQNSQYRAISYTYNDNFYQEPLIWALDENMDTLWTKNFTFNPNVSVEIRDIEPTPDGGFIIAAFMPYEDPQVGWVAKIDSLGNTCSVVGCDSVVLDTTSTAIIAEQWEQKYHLDFAPNPISRSVGSQLRFSLPQPTTTAWLRVYNMMGIEVKSQRLSTADQQAFFDARFLLSGQYVYVLEIGGQVFERGKLVVE